MAKFYVITNIEEENPCDYRRKFRRDYVNSNYCDNFDEEYYISEEFAVVRRMNYRETKEALHNYFDQCVSYWSCQEDDTIEVLSLALADIIEAQVSPYEPFYFDERAKAAFITSKRNQIGFCRARRNRYF